MKPKSKEFILSPSNFLNARAYCTEALGLILKAGTKQSLHWPESSQSAGSAPMTDQ